MIITCRQLIDFIAAYVDGELDTWPRFLFVLHLGTCRSCRAYLETYRRTIVLARQLATDDPVEGVPEELVRTILSAR